MTQSGPTQSKQFSAVLLAAIVLFGGIAVGIAPGSAVAQSGGFESADSTTVDENGSIAEVLEVPIDGQALPSRFDGTADGSVSVIVDGEPAPPGSELTVTALTDGEQVRFEINGVQATIERYGNNNNPPDTLASPEPGTEIIELSVGEEAIDGFSEFQIDTAAAPDTVGEGDTVPVTANISNIGNLTGTQDVNLTLADTGEEVDTTELRLEDNETATVDLQWATETGDSGTQTLLVQTEDDQVEVTVDVEEAQATPTLTDQSTDATTITSDDDTAPGVVVNLGDQNIAGELLVTYETDGGDLVVAGNASFDRDADSVVVPIEDTGGFPGTHTAHTLLASEVSGDYQPGDIVSDATVGNVIANDTGTVFDASVTIDDQQYNDSTTTVEVATADLQPAAASNYTVVVHNDTAGLPVLGQSTAVSGAQQNVTVEIDEIDANTDVVAMVHFADSGDPIPNADATSGFVSGGVSDAATVTITDSPFFEVTDPDPAAATVAAGSDVFPSANITNTGDFAATQNVTLTVTPENGTTVFDGERELTLPADSAAEREQFGVTFDEAGNYTYTIESANTSVSGAVTVVPEAEGNITLSEQATNSSIAFIDETEIFVDEDGAGIVAEDVEANVDSVIFATYDENGNTTTTGSNAFTASELNGTDTPIPLFDNAESVPNEFTVHVVPETEISETTYENVFNQSSLTGQVSADTVNASVANDSATIYEGSVAIEDAESVGNITEVTLSDATLRDGSGDNTEFAAVIYTLDEEGETLTEVGNVTDLRGSNANVDVALTENISERGVTETVAILHATDENGTITDPIPQATAGGFIEDLGDVPPGISDNATATVRAPANFEVLATQPTANGTVARGDIGAAALIQNTGDVNATQDVTFIVENVTSGTEVATGTQPLTLNASESVGSPGEAKPAFANIEITEAGTYNYTVETANDTSTVSFTVIEEAATGNISVNDQAVSSSTVLDDPAAPGVVIESVDANVDSSIFVFDEDGNAVAGINVQAAALDGSSQSVSLNDTSVPGEHTTYVVPSSEAPTVQSESDAVNASIATDTVTLFDGTVEFNDQTFTQQNISTVEIATAELLDGANNDKPFVVVVHPYDSSAGTIGDPVGSSGNLTGSASGVDVTFDEPISADGEYIAMLHEASGDGFGAPIAHGTADGFIASGVTDAATLTIDQPATAELSNLNIAGSGSDATIEEGDNTFVAVDVENTGDLQGEFNVTLTIGDTDVETRSVTLNGSDSDIQTETFSDVTGNLSPGEYDVSVDANGASITGTLTVNEASTSGGGGSGGGGGGGGGAPPSSPDPAVFNVSGLEPVNVTVEQGETIDVSATITNTGGQGAQKTVEFRVDDSVVAEEDVLLRSNGGETNVTFEDIDTSDLDAGDYSHGVFTENDSQTGTLTIETVDDGDGTGDGTGDGSGDGSGDGTDDGTGDGSGDGTGDGSGDGTTDDGTPGFGALVALLAVVLTAGLLTRRE